MGPHQVSWIRASPGPVYDIGRDLLAPAFNLAFPRPLGAGHEGPGHGLQQGHRVWRGQGAPREGPRGNDKRELGGARQEGARGPLTPRQCSRRHGRHNEARGGGEAGLRGSQGHGGS